MTIKTLELKWTDQKAYLTQIYSTGLEYCFVNDQNEQSTVMVLCKDYLHDAIWSTHNGKSVDIYGFKYDPTIHPKLPHKTTRIGIGNSSDKNFANKIFGIIDLLNQVEKLLKLKKSVAHLVTNAPTKYTSGFYVIEGSSRWMTSSPMISLYTLLIRIACVHTAGDSYKDTIQKIISGSIKPYSSNDQHDISHAQKGLDHIINNGYKKVFSTNVTKNFPKSITGYTLHDRMGIVRFSKNDYPKEMTHWLKITNQ